MGRRDDDDDDIDDVETFFDGTEDVDREVSAFQKRAGTWWGKYTDFQTLTILLLFTIILILIVITFLILGMYLGFYYGEPSLEKRIKDEIEDEINDFAELYILSGECVWESACPAIFTALLGSAAAETTCNGLGTSDLLQSCGLLDTSPLSSLSSLSTSWSSPTS